ncbi:MAG: hypothetical protein RL088_3232 [Verrucomicrobiota bacterium]|jgi:hypothetical protein
MKSRDVLIIAFIPVVAASVWLIMSYGDESRADGSSAKAASANTKSREGVAGKRSPENVLSGTAGGQREVDWNRFIELASGNSAFMPTPEQITGFLAKHGETAVNLVAVFEKTQERRFLDRALELFPNSPVVLMAAINAVPAKTVLPGEKSEPNPERLALIERLKAADPNNPLAWIFSAAELFKSGPNAGAIGEIRAALERPGFYIYSSERVNAATRLLEEQGIHPTGAGLVAAMGLTLPHMAAANGSSRMLMEAHKNATEAGDAAAADEALRLTYGLGRMFATPEASRLLIGELVGYAMESRALKALPENTRPEWLKVDPALRLAEIEKHKEVVKESTSDVTGLLESRNEADMAEYVRRLRTEGESAANRWLKTLQK